MVDNKGGSNPKRITIQLKSLNKGPVSETFNEQEKVKVSVNAAAQALGLDRNPPQPYEIFLEENGRPGRKLQLEATFVTEKIKDADILIILAPTSPDGASCVGATSSS